MFKSTNNFGILNFGGYIRTPFRLILSIYSYFLLYLTFFHKASCKGKKVYKCETSWPEWPELLPGSSPNNNSKVNCPNLGLMRSWGGSIWNQGPPSKANHYMFTLTTLPQAKSYILGNTTNMFHARRGITFFSNYVFNKKNPLHPPTPLKHNKIRSRKKKEEKNFTS